MRVLVTGAAGFLGSHIVDACLAQGDQVRVLVRSSSDRSYLDTLPVETVLGDVTSPEAARHATRGVNVVYHAAARVSDIGLRRDFERANVFGTENMLAAAKQNGVPRFVFVSSPSVVMDGRDQVDVDESVPYPPRYLNLYSETKALAEQRVLAESGPRFTTCAIRPRGVWGPRDRTGWLPKILARLKGGRFPDLSGGRRVYASLCYCANAADACLLAARSDRVGGRAYFVTDRETTDVWEFARAVTEMFGYPPITREVDPRVLGWVVSAIELVWRIPAIASRWAPPLSRYSMSLLTQTGTYDIGAAERDFGYRPRISRDDGMARFKAWVDEIGGVDAFTRYVA